MSDVIRWEQKEIPATIKPRLVGRLNLTGEVKVRAGDVVTIDQLLKLEQYINSAIAGLIYEEFGIGLRTHIEVKVVE